MQFTAHAFGVHLKVGTPRFLLETAPARSRTGFLSGTRRRGEPGLQPHPVGLFEAILKIGALKKEAKTEACLLGISFQNGAPRKS